MPAAKTLKALMAPPQKLRGGGKVKKVLGEFKRGTLRSGSKSGPKVTDRQQAIAIALSEAGVQKKQEGGLLSPAAGALFGPLAQFFNPTEETREAALQRELGLAPSLPSRFGESARASTAALTQAGLQDTPFDVLSRLFTGENPLEEARAGSEFLGPTRADLPGAEGKFEQAADIAGNVAPDIALGVASAPIAIGTAARFAQRGFGRLASLFAGETAQSLALAPTEFAREDRTPGEAALVTATAPIFGTALGTVIGRVFGEGISQTTENALIRGAVEGDSQAVTDLFTSGRGGVLADLADDNSVLRNATTPDELSERKTRLFLPPEAPALLKDGSVLDAGTPAAVEATESVGTRMAMTRLEYIQNLRNAIDREGGLSPKLFRRMTGDQPFRSVKGQERFQIDTLARRALKGQGVEGSKAQENLLDQMTLGQRRQLAIDFNMKKALGPEATAMLNSVIDGLPGAAKGQFADTVENAVLRAKRPSLKDRFLSEEGSIVVGGAGRFQKPSLAQQTRGLMEAIPDEDITRLRSGTFNGFSLGIKALGEELDNPRADRIIDEAINRAGENFSSIPSIQRSEHLINSMLDTILRLNKEGFNLKPSEAGKVLPFGGSEAGFVKIANADTLQKWYDKLIFWRNGSLLANPGTLGGNILGTTGFGATVPARNVAAAAADFGFSKLFGTARTRFAQDAAIETQAWMNALSGAIPGLRRSFNNPANTALREVAEATRVVREGVTLGNPFEDAGPFALVASKIPEWAFKGLSISDQFMFDKAFSARIYTNATRRAAGEGLSGDAARTRVNELLSRWTQQGAEARQLAGLQAGLEVRASKEYLDALQAGQDAIQQFQPKIEAESRKLLQEMLKNGSVDAEVGASKEFAEKLIFTAREGRKMDEFLDQLAKNRIFSNILAPFVPFRRTAMNIAREKLRSSPVGLFTAFSKFGEREGFEKGLLEAARTGELAALLRSADPVSLGQLFDDIGQAAVGTAISFGALGLIATGAVSVTPFDPKASKEERNIREAAGDASETVRIGSVTIPIRKLSPIGDFLLGAQEVVDSIAEMQASDQPLEATDAPFLAADFIGRSALRAADDTFLQSIEQFIRASQDDASLAAYAGRFTGSFIPRLIQPKEFPDFKQKEEDSLTKGILKGAITGPARQLGFGDPQIGPLGQPRTRAPGVPIPGTDLQVGLLDTRFGSTNPVVTELNRIEVFPPLRLPTGLELDKSQEFDVLQAKGLLQETIFSRIINSESYQGLGDEQKRRVLKTASRQVNRQSNQIIRARAQRGMDISFGGLVDSLGLEN